MTITAYPSPQVAAEDLFTAELYPHQYSELIQTALQEDLSRGGDLTSQALIPSTHESQVFICAREPGGLAGSAIASAVFAQVDPQGGVGVEGQVGGERETG